MITTKVHWKNRDQNFLTNRYSRAHVWSFDGGTEVAASSSPDIVPIPMSDASAVDPEEAFVASISSCHMLWFLSIAAQSGFEVNEYIDHAVGEMRKNSGGKKYIALVTLQPTIFWKGERHPTQSQIDSIHHQAHEECFIANSVTTEIRVKTE